MVRPKQKPSVAKKKTPTLRAEGKTQISISLPDSLVKQVDQLAAAENRNRSNFIATAMARIAGVKEEYQAPEEAAHLLRSPTNKRRLLDSIDALENCKGATISQSPDKQSKSELHGTNVWTKHTFVCYKHSY